MRLLRRHGLSLHMLLTLFQYTKPRLDDDLRCRARGGLA